MKIDSIEVRSECEREGDQHEPGGPREVLHDSLAAEVVEEDRDSPEAQGFASARIRRLASLPVNQRFLQNFVICVMLIPNE